MIGPAAAEVALGGPAGPEHAHRAATVGGVECLAVATDLGVDLIAPRAERRRACSPRWPTRAPSRSARRRPRSSRVEAGRPRFGREMTTATIPQEAGINERAVSFTKGCYIGQETVARLHYKGKPNRHLRGLRLERAGRRRRRRARWASASSGRVGTAVLSPARGPIALAILRREAEPGAAVEVGDGRRGRGRRAPVLGARSDTGRPHVELGLRARWAHGGG